MTPFDRTTRLDADDLDALDAIVAPADERMTRLYPGDRGHRQPVHTVYVPADQFDVALPAEWGRAARDALDEFAPTAADLAKVIDATPTAVEEIWPLLLDKLEREPIEDLRIDLEDGYGSRRDDVEDRDAVAAGRALADLARTGEGPPYSGVRFKAFEAASRRRGLRTLDLVTGALFDHGGVPEGWVVTLPKVTSVEQVTAMVDACARLERGYGLTAGLLRFEIQIETAQSILDSDGTALVAKLVHAGEGRCSGLHFGTYDYTAALGVSAAYQAMDHPAAEHAKQVMALAAAGTGVRVSDGSSNLLPVGSAAAVHRAWALHARLVRRSLECGWYQGWDLHPAQLVTRHATTFLFFREGLDDVGKRLSAYLAPQSVDDTTGDSGGALDEPATAQALANFVRRGVHCGAVAVDEVEPLIGADLATLDTLAARRMG